jgi:CheY-like chemotaxis protein
MDTLVAMLVDENADARLSNAHSLRAQGVQVIEARSAREAFGLALFGRLHCVVTRLPSAVGLRLCHELRRTPTTAALPVVLVSDGSPVSTDAVQAAGVTAVLPPDRTGPELLADIQQAIESAPSSPSPSSPMPPATPEMQS